MKALSICKKRSPSLEVNLAVRTFTTPEASTIPVYGYAMLDELRLPSSARKFILYSYLLCTVYRSAFSSRTFLPVIPQSLSQDTLESSSAMAERLHADTFPQLELNDQQKAEKKHIAMVCIHETLKDYDRFNSSRSRELNLKHWKTVKSQNNITMYKERHPRRRGERMPDLYDQDVAHPGVLVGHGTNKGTIDEVMYGATYHDEAAMQQGMMLTNVSAHNIIYDLQVVSYIESPTADQPFQSIKIQWALVGPPPLLSKIAKKRDSVHLCASGILRRDNGERVGYKLVHAIDLPSIPRLTERNVVRARASCCTLFRQLPNNEVEVFIKGYYEVYNNLLDKIAVLFVADAFMISDRALYCANRKKLSWMLCQGQHAQGRSNKAGSDPDSALPTRCQICLKTFSFFQQPTVCDLCGVSACRYCILQWETIDILPKLRLSRTKVEICTLCDKKVKETNTFIIARQEVLAGRFENPKAGTTLVDPSRVKEVSTRITSLPEDAICEGVPYELSPRAASLISLRGASMMSNDTTPMLDMGKSDDDHSLIATNGSMSDSISEASAVDGWEELIEQIQKTGIADASTLANDGSRRADWM